MAIKILYIVDCLDHGGTEKQLVQLINGLNPDYFEPHICTLKPSKGFYGELSIPKFCCDFVSFTNPSVVTTVKKIIKYVQCNQINIVQTFFQDPFLLAALSRPFHHACLVGSFRDLGFWRTRIESIKMRFAILFFSGYVANSQAVKDHFSETSHIKAEKIRVIANGFDIENNVGISEAKIDKRYAEIGIVANLNRPVKRVQDFISAAALIYEKTPDVRFTIVGDGYLRSEFEQFSASLGLESVVIFVGSQPNPLKLIKEFDVGVITSETEGFSNAIIEYMACGVPVVVTNSGGNPELVTEGENGFLVPVGDVELFADRIMKLLNKKLNKKVGVTNKKKILEEYSLSSMVDKYEKYYCSVLGLKSVKGVNEE